MKKINSLITIIFCIAIASCSSQRPDWDNASEIDKDPEQFNIHAGSSFKVNINGYLLTARAEYSVEARVLGVEKYKYDSLSGIIPYDIAMGWRAMSTTPTISALHIKQGQRRYYYSWFGHAPPRSTEIPSTSANVHIIPASEEVKNLLKFIKKNDRIVAEGYLVDVQMPNGSVIKTSMIRTDTWDGACEILYTTNIKVLSPP